jgi:hypothetical protein
MDNFDIPIFRKAYDLYRMFYGYRAAINKQDRYTIWQKCEGIILEIIENTLLASQKFKAEKLSVLEETSVKLNFLRVFLRLMKDVKTIDLKKYVVLEASVDEIGRMLGGWIKSSKEQ